MNFDNVVKITCEIRDKVAGLAVNNNNILTLKRCDVDILDHCFCSLSMIRQSIFIIEFQIECYF